MKSNDFRVLQKARLYNEEWDLEQQIRVIIETLFTLTTARGRFERAPLGLRRPLLPILARNWQRTPRNRRTPV